MIFTQSHLLQALAFIHAQHPQAALFVKASIPTGNVLLADLRELGYVVLDDALGLSLTLEGCRALRSQALTPRCTTGATCAARVSRSLVSG